MKTHPESPTPVKEEILRLPQVMERVTLSKSKIYELLNRTPPAFPVPIKLGRRCVFWPGSKIDKWINECIAVGECKS